MTDRPPFYLVWHEDGGTPTRKHPSKDAAEQEAERLARAHPGSRFFVLVPSMAVRRTDVQRERFDLDDLEIPF